MSSERMATAEGALAMPPPPPAPADAPAAAAHRPVKEWCGQRSGSELTVEKIHRKANMDSWIRLGSKPSA
eukprot:scaffold213018_cov17-Tisochrysis_lutea.AAC.1